MTQALNQHLYDAYGGFADKRYKKLVYGRTIAVDQHRSGGGINQSIHAMIFVAVYDGDEITLSFAGNVPNSAQVAALMTRLRRFTVDTSAVGLIVSGHQKPRESELPIAPSPCTEFRAAPRPTVNLDA